MTNLVTRYPKQTTWAEFSAKLARFYNLPHGSRFVLKRNGAAAKNGRSIVRSDIIIRRKPLRDAEHPNRYDNPTVSEVCRRIENMLAPHHRFAVIAFGPDGVRMHGHAGLKAWRDKTPKPTQQQMQQEMDNASLRREEIAMLSNMSLMMIADLKEGIEDPEQKIPQAVIQALLDQFDNNSVKHAVVELRLV